jgi:hypothetical protein
MLKSGFGNASANLPSTTTITLLRTRTPPESRIPRALTSNTFDSKPGEAPGEGPGAY